MIIDVSLRCININLFFLLKFNMGFSAMQKTWGILVFFSMLFAYLCSDSSAAHGWVVFGSLFGIILIIGNNNYKNYKLQILCLIVKKVLSMILIIKIGKIKLK